MRAREGMVSWSAVALGWLVALLAGAVISPLLRALYGLLSEPPVERDELTAALVVISLLAGFLAYLIGGYVAGRFARRAGGVNGAITAVFGLIFGVVAGIVLAALGVVFVEGVAAPPMNFGVAGGAVLAGLILFLANLFGGYVGGKLGEPTEA